MTGRKIPGMEMLARMRSDRFKVAAQCIEWQEEFAWPAPGFEDTEFGVLWNQEVGHGETEVHARVQA